MSDRFIEMILEIVQGLVALVLVVLLGVIAVIEILHDKPFNEPATLAALTGVAVTFYFNQRNQRRQQDTITTLTDKLVNGGTKQ